MEPLVEFFRGVGRHISWLHSYGKLYICINVSSYRKNVHRQSSKYANGGCTADFEQIDCIIHLAGVTEILQVDLHRQLGLIYDSYRVLVPIQGDGVDIHDILHICLLLNQFQIYGPCISITESRQVLNMERNGRCLLILKGSGDKKGRLPVGSALNIPPNQTGMQLYFLANSSSDSQRTMMPRIRFTIPGIVVQQNSTSTIPRPILPI